MKKMVLGLMVVAGLLGTSTVVANAADTDSTGDVTFSSGTLSLSVTDNTNLSFGSSTISAADTTLNASTTPTVEVSDLRGTNDGWSLTVAEGQQFNTASGSALTNAALTVASTKVSSDSPVNPKNATLTPGTTTSGTTTNGAAGTVASASDGDGNGVSTFTFGSSTLAVPGATTKLAKAYTTTLTWNLGDTPSN